MAINFKNVAKVAAIAIAAVIVAKRTPVIQDYV